MSAGRPIFEPLEPRVLLDAYAPVGGVPLEGQVVAYVTLPSVKAIVRAYAERWFIEQFFKDAKQLLGLGQYQNGSMRAAVIHLHLVCFAHALLTHLRLSRSGEKGNAKKAAAKASLSIGSMQNELRRLLFLDTVALLEQRGSSGDSFVKQLRRLLAA